MFAPPSKPTNVLELVPASLLQPWAPSFRARDITSEEAGVHVAYADLVTRLIAARGDVKDLSNASPLVDAELTNIVNAPQKEDLAEFNESISAEILSILDSDSNTNSQKAVKDVERGNADSVDINNLGRNNEHVLNVVQSLDDPQLHGPDAQQRIGASDMLSPADMALRTDVVDISKVFDMTNQSDIDLFGLEEHNEDEDGYDNDDETEGEDEDNDREPIQKDRSMSGTTTNHIMDNMLKKLVIKADGEFAKQSELDDELDTLIGESYGAPDLAQLKRKKARFARKKSNHNDTVWASDDVTDVSDFGSLVPEPVIEYPFTLDTFQKRAVYRLERDENVFVAAHTSAGKTVVAEYGIGLALNRKTKVIYTSPIKTLSNQKFRDFQERFASLGFTKENGDSNVGIITGDLSINPDADCLIMTTEILRSMLYKGADLVRDLSHVIFDECHWLNDPQRGVVWEEAIIMLPKAVTIIMLSATVPNAMEFAKWVGLTKEKPVHVIHTAKRPVPLSHQIFIKGETFQLFDSSQGRFLDANYRKALAHYKENTKAINIKTGGGRNHSWMQIIKFLRKRDLDPAIIFCFSKRKCDEAAEMLHGQDLTSGAADKSHIHQFYQAAISRLSAADRDVPQIIRHREMLKKGIGIHHAGLLPIIKEITEVLFQSGYIRILFATETFAMGVNMPARTVVFTAIHKFDSQSYRLLEPGEYVQMAGRAGRRGLDDVGNVILYPTIADFPVESDVKNVIAGVPKPLRSQFRLTYNMILNLLRIEELRVEDVMARSFSEAPAKRNSKGIRRALDKGSQTLSAMQQHGAGASLQTFRDLFDISLIIQRLSCEIASAILKRGGNAADSVFSAGRVVLARRPDRTLRLAVVIKSMAGASSGGSSLKRSLRPLSKLSVSSTNSSAKPDSLKAVTLLGGAALSGVPSPLCASGVSDVESGTRGAQCNINGVVVEIGNIALDCVDFVSALTVPVDERALNPIRGGPNMAALSAAADALHRLCIDEALWAGLPGLQASRDVGLHEVDAVSAWGERASGVNSMLSMLHAVVSTGAVRDMRRAFKQLDHAATLEAKLGKLRAATSDETLHLMPDYRQKAAVLQRLGYIDGSAVRLKGRAACEVNTCESIILTELVYEQVLQSLSAVDLAAVLSALVFTERLEDGEAPGFEHMKDSPQILKACTHMDAVMRSIGAVIMELGADGQAPAEYVRQHARFGFVKGVRDWADGKSFKFVCGDYDGLVAEGTIVRTIIRLCELLRELKNVGRVIGDPALQSRAQEASDLCRRDVIFAASLYVA